MSIEVDILDFDTFFNFGHGICKFLTNLMFINMNVYLED